jgi:GNAT superfamily N-acetyltransferase
MSGVIKVLSVDWLDERAVALRAAMSEELAARYHRTWNGRPERPPGFDLDPATVVYTALAVDGDAPVGHAGLRTIDAGIELKRMFVARSHRGTEVARQVLRAAEEAARRRGHTRLLLHTGDEQPDAIRFYEKSGYTAIAVYPPYDDFPGFRFYEKALTAA